MSYTSMSYTFLGVQLMMLYIFGLPHNLISSRVEEKEIEEDMLLTIR